MHAFAVALLLGLAVSAAGCADPPATRPGVHRSNVATPFVTLSPSEAKVLPGAKITLTAKPGGGEAMRFTVDWRVQEEAAGGQVEGIAARQDDGTYVAVYTAPTSGQGPYHVTVSLHEYPQARAMATIDLVH
jgi:hypothetical protein